MMAHGGLVLERIAAAQELSRRVTERDLIIYVQGFLNRRAPGHQFRQTETPDEFSIQFPSITAADLDDFCRRKGIIGQTTLGNGMPRQCRFRNKLTSASSKAWECIHQFHPLIRFVSQQLMELDEAFYPLVSVKVSAQATEKLPVGDYMFALRSLDFLWSTRGGVAAVGCLRTEQTCSTIGRTSRIADQSCEGTRSRLDRSPPSSVPRGGECVSRYSGDAS